MVKKIAVVGAGTMGNGIAQVFASSGYSACLFDTREAALEKGMATIRKNLDFLVGKEKMTATEADTVFGRIAPVSDIAACTGDLVVEAIVEDLDAKTSLFRQLAAYNPPETLLASNTSSLSITALQKKIPHPARGAGLHFFNPAPLMKLVEVVRGEQTAATTIDTLTELCRSSGKIAVVCKDAPGFIVNRVARHYYLEAMKLLEEGVAGVEEIDSLMDAAGFRMGPFRLMDLIGMDINYAVSESIYEAFGKPERFRPSDIQKEKVQAGDLGRKTGRGFYNY
jgi:3-hydroxybutyryl-CoA dehydrogenase